jgi:hypothetical protein
VKNSAKTVLRTARAGFLQANERRLRAQRACGAYYLLMAARTGRFSNDPVLGGSPL